MRPEGGEAAERARGSFPARGRGYSHLGPGGGATATTARLGGAGIWVRVPANSTHCFSNSLWFCDYFQGKCYISFLKLELYQ